LHYDAESGELVADEVLWPLADHLGSIRNVAVLDDHGTPETSDDRTEIPTGCHFRYDAFGRALGDDTPAAVDFLFAFTGRPFDSDTGLQWNLHRWYDPQTGRWLSEDPLGFAAGDENLYRYVGNQVTIGTDPLGHSIFLWPIHHVGLREVRDENGNIKRNSKGDAIMVEVNLGIDQQATKQWIQKVVRALGEMCPCVSVKASMADVTGTRFVAGTYQIAAVVNPEFGDEAAFCACVDKHVAGCTLLHDLLKAGGERGALVIQHTTEMQGRWTRPRDPVRIIKWNPRYAGPQDSPGSTSTLVLAHEMGHAWEGSWVQENGRWVWRVPPSLQRRRPSPDAPLAKEISAVRIENQVGMEIYGTSYQPRTTYTETWGIRKNVPLPTEKYFDKCEKCAKWFYELRKEGWK